MKYRVNIAIVSAGAVKTERQLPMTKMLLDRAPTDTRLMPITTTAMINRMTAFVAAMGGLVDLAAGQRMAMLAGCLVMPYAGLVIAGTACKRPLLFPEGETMVRRTGLDLILLRYVAERGVTFDVRLAQDQRWLCCYRAWRMEGDLWLVPDMAGLPSVRVTAVGLELESKLPFGSPDERQCGLLDGLTIPFFQRRD